MTKETLNFNPDVDPLELIKRPDICKFVKKCLDPDLLKELANVALNYNNPVLDEAFLDNEILTVEDRLLYASKALENNLKRGVKELINVFKNDSPPSKKSQKDSVKLIRKKIDPLRRLKSAYDLARNLKQKKYLTGAQGFLVGITYDLIKNKSTFVKEIDKRVNDATSSSAGLKRQADNMHEYLTGVLGKVPIISD